VDTSRAMLESLRHKLKTELPAVRRRVQITQGDMRSLALGTRFDWVIAPFNTILHLYTEHDVEGFFAVARNHLKARVGRLVFDYATPRVKDLSLDPQRWFKGGR